MILEGIVTTISETGEVNIAPMGPHVDDAMKRFVLRPFPTSQTYKNLKAYGEGVHRLFTDRELSRRAIANYGRAIDAKTNDAVYQYAVDYVDKIPYNTREGVQEVLNQIAPRNPKAKTAKPEEFYDDRFVKELDSQGFYKQLWK